MTSSTSAGRDARADAAGGTGSICGGGGPVVILGVERSGTTLLYSLLSNHPDLYWLSRLDSVMPRWPRTATLLRRVMTALHPQSHVAVPGAISRSTGLVSPSECLPYWRAVFGWGDERDYRVEDDHFTEDDVTDGLRERLCRDLSVRCRWSGRSHVLLKQPGFALKVRFLAEVFPDAYFVHVLRHPYWNWVSLVRAKRRSEERFWGTKTPGWRELLDVEPEVQAALQMEAVSAILESDVQRASIPPGHWLRVRYEDLTSRPQHVLERIARNVGIPPPPELGPLASAVRAAPPTGAGADACPDEAARIIQRLEERHGYERA